jgi:AcrR family transcriptional regulator
VPEIQRARILAALVEVTRERGAGQVTVAHVVARSGVSRRTFYELFEDREDCFLAAFDEAVTHAGQRVLPAVQSAGSVWHTRLRAGLRALLEFLEDEPALGAFCVVDTLGAGPGALKRRAEVIDILIDAVDEGRAGARAGLLATRLTAEGAVGAVLGVLHARLLGDASRLDDVIGLLGPLMGMIVLPYLGAAAAAREAAKPAPRPRRAVPLREDPLRDLEMRLTYRTVRVLLTIASMPDASNRRVADGAGIQDQGQISKLLARLEHLGLIHNTGGGHVRGEPNAWRLSARGEQIERTIRQRTTPTGG